MECDGEIGFAQGNTDFGDGSCQGFGPHELTFKKKRQPAPHSRAKVTMALVFMHSHYFPTLASSLPHRTMSWCLNADKIQGGDLVFTTARGRHERVYCWSIKSVYRAQKVPILKVEADLVKLDNDESFQSSSQPGRRLTRL